MVCLEQVGSTNDVAKALGAKGAPEGTVVIAEAQSAGRGRQGRKWFSPAGRGLWMSVILRPAISPGSVGQLSLIGALAVAAGIERATGLRAELEWPNDVLIGGAKVGGVLPESVLEAGAVREVVLGIGVNVSIPATMFPPALRRRATSLQAECGSSVDRAQVAAAVLEELESRYLAFVGGGLEKLLDEYRSRCGTLGCDVVVTCGGERVRGKTLGIDAQGALLVRGGEGVRPFNAGEVFRCEVDRALER